MPCLTKVQNAPFTRVAIVGPRRELDGGRLAEAPWQALVDRVVDRPSTPNLDARWRDPRVVVVVAEAGDRGRSGPPVTTRTSADAAYVLARAPARLLSPVEDDWDVEGIVDLDRLTPEAHRPRGRERPPRLPALGRTRLIPEYYLDATYNRIFDWFETTKWDWREVDLSQIRRDLLTEPGDRHPPESRSSSFGTLPGAHNFLREWAASTASPLGALLGRGRSAPLTRPVPLSHEIGIEVRAKHALYKRERTPIGGEPRRDAHDEHHLRIARGEYLQDARPVTREPVLRTIWRLLDADGHDTARLLRLCKELVDRAEENAVAAVQMAYVWARRPAPG